MAKNKCSACEAKKLAQRQGQNPNIKKVTKTRVRGTR